jgi:hypothetical protein
VPDADADGEALDVWVCDVVVVGVVEPGALGLEVDVPPAECVGVWDELGEAELAVALELGEALRLTPALVVGASDMDTTWAAVVFTPEVDTEPLLAEPAPLPPELPKTRKPTTAMPAQPPVTMSPSPRRFDERRP